ncbi:MAG: SRPBCC domain-containing protein [Pseudomonadota bacterium]
MELTGERVLNASRDDIFKALHDATLLRQAVPGCQRFTRLEGDRYEAEIALKVGPFTGKLVTMVNVYNDDPPMGFSLQVQADGGDAMGGGDGDAHVALAVIDENTTNLAYHLSAIPRGPIAELTDEILEKKAKTLVAEFFSRFELVLTDPDQHMGGAGTIELPAADDGAASTDMAEPLPVAGVAAIESAEATTRARVEERSEPTSRNLPAVMNTPPPPAPMAAAGHSAAEASFAAEEAAQERAENSAPQPPPLGRQESYGQTTGWRQSSRDAPVLRDTESTTTGITRWFLVLVGLIIIFILLSDGG